MYANRPHLFDALEPEEYQELLSCGGLRPAEYARDAVIFHAGDTTDEFGILLSGEVHIESLDLWGNRIILHSLSAGQAFAESYALCQAPMTVDVTATQPCRVLFVRMGNLLDPANGDKSWYPKLLRSLLVLSARKNLAWSGRMLCITAKIIRSRVMAYLSAEAMRCGGTELSSPSTGSRWRTT